MDEMRARRLKVMKSMVKPGAALLIVLLLGLWGCWLASVNTPVFGRPHSEWLAIAAVATIFCPIVAVLVVRNYLYLLEHGVEVTGQVSKIAMIPLTGRRPVTFSYTFNGQEYSIKKDTEGSMIRQLSVGSPVMLLVDPKKPGNASVYDYRPGTV